jgi:hypothetical protein
MNAAVYSPAGKRRLLFPVILPFRIWDAETVWERRALSGKM